MTKASKWILLCFLAAAALWLVPQATAKAANTSGSFSERMSQLQAKFPAGKYWNHTRGAANNPDGYTSSPCTHHGNCSANGYNGWCGCNSFNSQSIQCMGFAEKLAYDTFGTNPRAWPQSTNLSNVKAGDIIYYQYGGHTIFVTGVSGNTITYADCNSDGHCIIRWNASMDKSAVTGFQFLRHATNYDDVITIPADTNIYFANSSMPGSITAGGKYPLSGTVSCAEGILDVCIQLYRGTDKLHEAYVMPRVTSYDISSLASTFPTIDTPGIYHLLASALNYSSQRVEIFNFYFIVLSNKETVANGIYNIKSYDHSLSMDVIGHDHASGAKMITAESTDSPYQKYYISYVGSGYYTIINCGTGHALDVANASNKAGTSIQQCIFKDNPAQHWQIIPMDGCYYFVPECANNLCMDISYWPEPLTAGKRIQLWTPNDGPAERFNLIPATYRPSFGERVVFDAQGGSLPTASVAKPITGTNRARGEADVILYNAPNAKISLNIWGAGAAVNANGLVTAVCHYSEPLNLTVPVGGFVITAHISNSAMEDINALEVGQSVSYDLDQMAFRIYSMEDGDGRLADSTYRLPGEPYGCLPIPQKEGCLFDGWYTQKEGGARVSWHDACSSFQLYAHWKEPSQAEAVSSITYSGHEYELYDLPMSWQQAKEFCEERGGSLACITSKEENDAVLSLAEDGAAGWYWLGCSDEETEGDWKWVTGESFSYSNWDPQAPEPSNGTGENYGTLINRDNPPNKQRGEWNDTTLCPANNNFYGAGNSGFICEYDKKTLHSCDISLSNTSYTYDGTDKTPAVSVKDGEKELILGIDYSISYSNNQNAGTGQVTITGEGSYTGIATETFTILKATPHMSFAEESIVKTYGDASFANPLTADHMDAIRYRSYDRDVALVSNDGQVTIQNAGTAKIAAYFRQTANYNACLASYTLTVHKAAYDMSQVAFNSVSVEYDGSPHFLSLEGALPEGVTVSYQNNGHSEIGSYEVTAQFSGDSKNYEAIPDMKATLHIVPISTELYFQAKTVNKTYGDGAFVNEITNLAGRDLAYASSDEAIAAVDPISGQVSICGAGTATITATAPETDHYTAATASYTLNVQKAAYDMSQVRFPDCTVEYDGNMHSLSIEGSLPEGVSVEYTGNGQTEPGIYTVTASFTGNENYKAIPNQSATLTITKQYAPFAFEENLVTKVFGDAPFTNKLVSGYEGVPVQYSSSSPNVAAVGGDGLVTITGSGQATITAMLSENGNGQTLTASYHLEVQKGEYDLSQIAFPGQTYIYDGTMHSLEIQGELPEGVTVAYSGNQKIYPGEYKVTARFYGDEDNHLQIPGKSAVLTIKKAMPSLQFKNASISKTDGDPAFRNPLVTESDGAITYKSSNASVAKAGKNGEITILGSGSATITATCEATDLYEEGTASFQLTVVKNETDPGNGNQPEGPTQGVANNPVKKITVTGISKKIAAGKSIRLKAGISPSSAKNYKLVWKSSNTKVAAVTQNGKVAVKKRTGGKSAVITVMTADGKVKASYKVTSMKGIVKKISISGAKTVKAGKSLKLKANVSASNGANKKLAWKSSNRNYATVSSSGTIKAKKAGKGKRVKITAMATDGSGKEKTVTVKII